MAAPIKKHAKWQTVKIDPNVFQLDNFASLVCMQELTDYDVIDNTGKIIGSNEKKKPKRKLQEREKKNSETSNKKKRKKKRKLEKNKTEVIPFTNEPPTKKEKRKKKKVRQGKLAEIKSTDVEIESSDLATDIDVKKRKAGNIQEAAPLPKKKIKLEKKQKTKTDTEDAPLDKKKIKLEKKEKIKSDTAADMVAWSEMYVPDQVLRALQELKFTVPTPIQTMALAPAIRDRMDIVGAAETGSGKTLAFGIPIIHRILRLKQEKEDQKAAIELASSDDNSGSDHDEASEDFDQDPDPEDVIDSEMMFPGLSGSESDRSATSASEDEDSDEEIAIKQELDDLHGYMQHGNDDVDGGSDDDDDGFYDSGDGVDDGDEFGDGSGDDDAIEDMVWEQKRVVSSESDQPLYALILTPTRELAIQVKDHLIAVAKYTCIKVIAITGGMAPQKQLRLLKKCPEIVVATPGRLWELIQEGEVHLNKVCDLSCLVIDEADRMVEKGHFEELAKLLQIINDDEERKKKRQTFVFSATLTFVHAGPQRLKYKKKTNKMDEKQKLEMLMTQIGIKVKPKIIDLTRSSGTAETLTEARINTTTEEKDLYLYYFIRQFPGRTLVFANSKDCIRRLVSIFKLLKCCPLSLHADMHQRQRLKNLDKFKGNPHGLLLATDVAARGLDIPNVQHVVHYQVPRTTENYVHRSGRTARASKEGLSVMLVGPEDLQYYRKIIKSLNKDEDLPLFPILQDLMPEVKTRVNLARTIDKDEHRMNKKKRENQWYEKAAREMDIELDEDQLMNDLGSQRDLSQGKKKLELQREDLKYLLETPLHRTYFGKYPTKSGKLPFIHSSGNHGAAVSKVKEEHKKDQKLMLRHRIQQPSKLDKIREKRLQKIKKKRNKHK